MSELPRIEFGNPDGTWTDISGYISDVHLTQGRAEPDEPIQPAKLHLDGEWQGTFAADAAAYKLAWIYGQPKLPRTAQVTIERPDGRWQAIKARIKRHRAFRWLKVRTVKVTITRAVVDWPQGWAP